MIGPVMKYVGQIPTCLGFGGGAQFVAAYFLSCQVCENATHRPVEILLPRNIFECKQEERAFVRLGGLLHAAVTEGRPESWLLFGCGTQALIRSDQPHDFPLASGFAAARFCRV